MAVQKTQVGPYTMAYREQGSGEAVVMLHGWPTSSYLYRKFLPIIGKSHRAIAPDLLGFGQSDKPTNVVYSLPFMAEQLDGLLNVLGVDSCHLIVHDLGGPIGLYWAINNQSRVLSLCALNTVIFDDFSLMERAVLSACKVPGLRWGLTSKMSLSINMKMGVGDSKRLSKEAIAAVQAPFKSASDRRALYHTLADFKMERFRMIAEALPSFTCPVRGIYGEKDRVLPRIGYTMAKLKEVLPQTQLTNLPSCGHFLQEEKPEHIATLIASFLERQDQT